VKVVPTMARRLVVCCTERIKKRRLDGRSSALWFVGIPSRKRALVGDHLAVCYLSDARHGWYSVSP
jgi:hypothetical protein